MNIISLIIIIVIIKKILENAGTETNKTRRHSSVENVWDQAAKTINEVVDSVNAEVGTYQRSMQSYQDEQEIRDKMARTKQRILEKRTEAKNTTILERSIKNTDANKVDITLTTLEAEHKHSERVSAAEHYHPEDVMPENMLGTIEDLMVKGYDGQLCFERDFMGEAMDMISHFTVPSDVPEF